MKNTSRNSSSGAGFALVIALSLMAFVLLLLLGITAFVRIEQSNASNAMRQLEARQNALLGLQIAMGALQQSSGPDRRITATADIRLPDAVTINASTTGSDAKNRLDTYWHDARNRHWTGVWLDPDPEKTGYDKEDPSAGNPQPELQQWLVSQPGDANVEPTQSVSGLNADGSAQSALSASLNGKEIPMRLLVGHNKDAGLSDARKLARTVSAPQIGLDGINGRSGNFAWWVGDEGVKARANLRDPYWDASNGTTEATYRLQSAQRVAMEAMTGASSGTFKDLSGFTEMNDPRLDSIFNRTQLSFLPSLSDERLNENFHDITVASYGVLSNARDGGLQYDLSKILGIETESAFQTAIGSVFGESMDADYNLLLQPKFTIYATVPNDPAGVSTKGSYRTATPDKAPINFSATWEQLRSGYNLKNASTDSPAGVFETATAVTMREPSDTEVGIYPIVTHAKVFYELDLTGATVKVKAIPLVVLANPYNVDMTGSVRIEIGTEESGSEKRVQLVFGTNGDDPGEDPVLLDPGDGDTEYAGPSVEDLDHMYLGDARLLIENLTLPAGEAHVYMLNGNQNNDGSTDTEAVMEPGFGDPRNGGLIYDTGIDLSDYTIDSEPVTHASLRARGDMEVSLFITGNGSTGKITLGRFKGQRPLAGNADDAEDIVFIVAPTENGTTNRGAGIILTGQDSFAQLHPTEGQLVQQSLFYQVNLRGYGAVAPGDTLEPVILHSRGKKLSLPDPGNEENFQNHLMLADDFEQVRWGIVNNGQITNPTVAPSPVDTTKIAKLFLYDLPREEHPVTSLGQLQHFNLSGRPAEKQNQWIYVQAYQVNYPISNSYPNPRVMRDAVFSTSNPTGPQWDSSYMLNRILWDRFYFSSYPSTGAFDFDTEDLINHRLTPFRPRDAVALDDPENFRGNGNQAEDALRAAENLMVAGAFNINSTSVNAWKAVLSSLRNVPVGSETDSSQLTAPFARTLFQTGGTDGSQDPARPNAWEGFSNLSQSQIDAIAEEMALEAMKRGPFMSMADFVNRMLVAKEEDTYGLGLSGALQSAIDKVVNQRSSITSPYDEQSADPNGLGLLADADYLMPSILSGAPGYLLQADILSALGPILTARSDTFVIRSYGDATGATTDKPLAQVWCEAVVQRTPDYVDPTDAATEQSPSGINALFGRKYEIVSFRWLHADEI